MACQCRDFPQSYVAVPLAIAACNLFYCLDPYLFLKLIILFLNQVCAHSQPMAGCGHTPGFLKLFSEKCVCVCIVVCVTVVTSSFRSMISRAKIYQSNDMELSGWPVIS